MPLTNYKNYYIQSLFCCFALKILRIAINKDIKKIINDDVHSRKIYDYVRLRYQNPLFQKVYLIL